MNISNISIRNKLLISNGFVIFLLGALFTIVWNAINTMEQTSKKVEHTYKVIDHANGLVSAMIDQETGLRGFAIGGQTEYLEPYVSGKDRFKNDLSIVKQLISDNPTQQRRFDKVENVAMNWQKYAEKIIKLRKDIKSGENAATEIDELLASGMGKKLMDEIRVEVKDRKFGYKSTDVLQALINMETGLRGYIINKDENYLEPYYIGKKELDNLFKINDFEGETVSAWINKYAEVAISLIKNGLNYKVMEDLYQELSSKQGKIYMDELRSQVNDIIAVEKDLMLQRKMSAENAADLATKVIIFGGIITAILALTIGIVISKTITGPIGRAVVAAKELANGNLTIQIKPNGNNEVGVLLTALQTTADSLKQIILKMSNASDQLGYASDNLTTITTQSSQGVKEQQHMTDEVAVAMNQMSMSVQEVAQNAFSAAQFANEANREAQSGIIIVKDTIEGIHQLDEEINLTSVRLNELVQETENIGGILDVIRGIADQTNLLALNAAIEAARAGDQGRGFAVVADEVRELAKRTQDSTTEIQVLIEKVQLGTNELVDSMDKSNNFVKESVVNATRSRDAFGVISESIAKINDMNTQTANASEEQSTTTEEINRNMEVVNMISQQSAQSVNETVKSTQELSVLSSQMHYIIRQFKV
ncbi:CHASE3 domain-containing protein [Photobacterium angustum]|uniref:CHASE3 domain-containing protein n=1 Tax=Photobacterium angustum TaxID=661 RepID=UPI0005E22F3E|nr:CHASE3 domain-containing protein [Photobacterium angustum]KJG17661.1 chemotaxis protein [Photobacterium angustum]KJG24865.1 chemotaxis protein [Photobacterium angustum]KJG33002.1 chemotaxis protein [Photobacterium angustum]PSW97627.1 HAMP domain-containing protein [Photobacterium angustum]PSX01527.1 HAMP domain-containing protein [Photobacterium angustum]